MKRSLKNLTTLGFFTLIIQSSFHFALAGSHSIKAKKLGIVKLYSITGGGQCTGSIVGVRPLTVLTAFHCISHLENGDVMVGIEKEKELSKQNPLSYLSTKAILPPSLKKYPEYPVLKEVDREIVNVTKTIEQTKKDLNQNQSDKALLTLLHEQTTLAQQMNSMYQQVMRSILMRSMADDAAYDLAVLVFDRYQGPLNQQNEEDLLASGEMLPISPSTRLVGTTASFAGFGITGELGLSGAAKEMGAFVNTIRSQKGNLLATFGMLPGKTGESIAKGTYGAILPGDSGGPLMNDYGIVGVASYIKRDPMESDREPAPGWPQDRDGFYSYMTGRYVDLNSDLARDLVDYAKNQGNAIIVHNDLVNLALTDLSTWEQPQPYEPSSPAPESGSILALAPTQH